MSAVIQPAYYQGRYGDYKDAFQFYEDGKHRRYTLLFSVNAAVAAIAKLGPSTGMGLLSTWAFGIGMIAFTVLMFYDIGIFGWRFREETGDSKRGYGEGIFSLHGQIVLIGCCAIIIVGWVLLAAGHLAL
jgi:hypothetical protein